MGKEEPLQPMWNYNRKRRKPDQSEMQSVDYVMTRLDSTNGMVVTFFVYRDPTASARNFVR